MNLRRILGRTRLAVNFVLGRQVMERGVDSNEDDVWIVSYPKSGNTWTRFLVANLIAGDTTVDWTNIERIVPDTYINRDSQTRRLPRPRYFKSHEPYRPKCRRVLLIVRDPRDIAVSYYHFALKTGITKSVDSYPQFMEQFLAGRIDPYGSWGENVGSWLGARRGTADFTVVQYEDLLQDAESHLTRIANALRLPVSPERIRQAVEKSSADRMREMEKLQHGRHKYLKRTRTDIPFVRAARSGQWQTELPPEAVRQIESAWGGVMRELGYLSLSGRGIAARIES